ncbi:UdgX family uracil-DNA binding protein [Jatrophihabitans sp. DSM 45814]
MAQAREGTKAAKHGFAGAEGFVPRTTDLRRLAEAAASCEGCDLYRTATQTVFGIGPKTAQLFLVGEQPGDIEDKEGLPFVGPAGHLLDRALDEAGIDRTTVFLTNAVKHFRWHPDARGKRRIHQKPDAGHLRACRPWLSSELAAVGPRVVVALGAVAAQVLVGPQFRVTKDRGKPMPWPADSPTATLVATVHPSAVLRADDRQAALRDFVRDLEVAARLLS